MKIKIPNILTIGRIIIVPIFVLSFYIPGIVGDLVPFFLFAVASFTDYLDGLLARLYKEESKLGELLDPIADKILVAAALVLLVMNGIIKNLEVIAAIIILTREILISGLREFLAKRKEIKDLFAVIFPECKYLSRIKYVKEINSEIILNSTLLISLMVLDKSSNYEYFCHKYKSSNNLKEKLSNFQKTYFY